jgi:hypothetical protein
MTDATMPSPALPAPLRWLARRLVLPALASTVLIEALMFLAWSATQLYMVPLDERAGQLPLLAALVFGAVAMFVIGFGLLLIGVPAGYLVARLELGFGPSLAGLIALGAAAGASVSLLVAILDGGFSFLSLEMVALCATAGAATAAVWTLVNRDLFRRHNGA